MAVRRRTDRGNTWWVDFTYKHADGRRERIRRQSPVNTKAGAENYERQLRARMMDAGTLRDTSMTLNELFKEFMQVKTAECKESTIIKRRCDYEAHIKGALGDTQVAQIDTRAVARFTAKLSSEVAPRTVQGVLSTLSVMLTTAKKWGIINSTPEFHPPKIHQKEPEFLSFEDADKLLEAAQGMTKTAIALGLKAGLRVGEIFGLRWSDVDFRKKELHIRQQLSFATEKFTSPKSNKARVVPIPDSLVSILHSTPRMLGSDLVVYSGGNPASRYTVKRWFACAYEAAGFHRNEGAGWHILRHTYASHLVMRGVPLKVVQELLGHATIAMTMRYAHLSPETKSAAVAVLDVTDKAPLRKAEANQL